MRASGGLQRPSVEMPSRFEEAFSSTNLSRVGALCMGTFFVLTMADHIDGCCG